MSDQPQQVRIIRFIGKISWEGQSNGLPPEIFAYVFYDASLPPSEVTKIIEQQLAIYRHLGGMPVEKDQGQLIDMKRTIMDRVIVLTRWIVHIHPDIVPIPGNTPLPDDEGVERLPDGTPALKN